MEADAGGLALGTALPDDRARVIVGVVIAVSVLALHARSLALGATFPELAARLRGRQPGWLSIWARWSRPL